MRSTEKVQMLVRSINAEIAELEGRLTNSRRPLPEVEQISLLRRIAGLKARLDCIALVHAKSRDSASF